MTPKQILLVNKIVALHKDNEGKFDWLNYYYSKINKSTYEQVFDEDKETRNDYQSLTVIKQYLIDKELITFLYESNDTLTVLKPAGWKWESFEKELKVEQSANRKKKIIDFPKLYWFPIAIVTYFAGLYTDRLKNKLFPQDLQKKEQEQILKPAPLKVNDTTLTKDGDSLFKPK